MDNMNRGTKRKWEPESPRPSGDYDRFIPTRPDTDNTSSPSTRLPLLAVDNLNIQTPSKSGEPPKTPISAQLLPYKRRRLLSFQDDTPQSTPDHMEYQRMCVLDTSPTSSRLSTGSKRKPPYNAIKVLDAVGLEDDFHLNLHDWSCRDQIIIGLERGEVYVYDNKTREVAMLGNESTAKEVTCVSWAQNGIDAAIGRDNGDVEIWDTVVGTKQRTMSGQKGRVPSLSWNGQILSSGCRNGEIWNHDLRVPKHKVMQLSGHTKEVCGLKWRPDGGLLASGSNDDTVKCWDLRYATSAIQTIDEIPRATSKWTWTNHTAAVKALAWCPWQPSLLATGGGSGDRKMRFWSTTTGENLHTIDTGSQITSIIFSPTSKEFVSTHGYPTNSFCLWNYLDLTKIYDKPAHPSRILGSSLSPDGTTLATVACDETLRFWKIWEAPIQVKKPRGNETDRRIMAGLR